MHQDIKRVIYLLPSLKMREPERSYRTSSSYQCKGALTHFTHCFLASCVLDKHGGICSVLLPVWGETAHMVFYHRLIFKPMSCTFFLSCVFALVSWSAAHLLMTCRSTWFIQYNIKQTTKLIKSPWTGFLRSQSNEAEDVMITELQTCFWLPVWEREAGASAKA